MGPEDFAYQLPDASIAQVPLEDRPSARLLDAVGDHVEHRTVRDLPSLLGPGDVLVVNDTRVLPTRLRARRDTGGASEVLLLRVHDDDTMWEALVRPSRKLPEGTVLAVDDELSVEVGRDLGEGRRHVRLLCNGPVLDAINRCGEMPLPPYLTTVLADPDRYQTVYSRRSASAAAPTAGLHLTADVLDACRTAGARIESLELVVGLDTFRPVTVDDLDDHRMHREDYCVPAATLEACRDATRVVAVGTTTVRALESAALSGPEGRTDLFIRPPFDFQVVDVLLTNFHQPRSSLLVMLEAFTGKRWRGLYKTALADVYRFLSFGDAMLVGRAGPSG